MLILSNSMCKSASTIIWWYKVQLIDRTVPANGYKGLAEFIASGAVPGHAIFVADPLTDQTVDRLIEYADQHGPTVVKTHCHMTTYLDQLIREGKVLATYAHRDPRDVILSAIDHRARDIESGGTVWFDEFSSVEESIKPMLGLCVQAMPWIEHPNVPKFLYRDTVAHPDQQIRALAKHLKAEITEWDVEEILRIEAGGKTNSANWNQFNQAKATRYRREMTQNQIELCNRELGPWIEKLGYQVDDSDMTLSSSADSSAA